MVNGQVRQNWEIMREQGPVIEWMADWVSGWLGEGICR